MCVSNNQWNKVVVIVEFLKAFTTRSLGYNQISYNLTGEMFVFLYIRIHYVPYVIILKILECLGYNYELDKKRMGVLSPESRRIRMVLILRGILERKGYSIIDR